MTLEHLTDKQLKRIVQIGPYPAKEEKLEILLMIKMQRLRAEMELELRSLAKAIGFKRNKKGNWEKK